MLLRSTIPILKTTHVTITSVFGRGGGRLAFHNNIGVCRFQSNVASLNKKISNYYFIFIFCPDAWGPNINNSDISNLSAFYSMVVTQLPSSDKKINK